MTMTDYRNWCVYFEDLEIERQRQSNRANGIVDFSDPKATKQLIGMVNAGGAKKPLRKARRS